MKTTHQLTQELLALPDVPVIVELWCDSEIDEPTAEMTAFDPTGTAVIWQKPKTKEADEAEERLNHAD